MNRRQFFFALVGLPELARRAPAALAPKAFTFTAHNSQAVTLLAKALEAGHPTIYYGSPLKVESIEWAVKSVTYSSKHIVFNKKNSASVV